MDREIHFCEASDGVRLAWARHGAGPPVARAATWLTHLAFDWESPVWRHWLDGLGLGHTFLRYDERGCGLSDRETNELSLERWVADLEVVVDSAGLDQFALLGISHGAATAVAYAVRHPDRVHRLVIYGGYARGRALRGEDERRRQEAYVAAVRAGWSDPNPAFRRMFTMQFLPEGTEEQLVWYDELQRRSTSAEIAARLFRARGQIDVTELAPRVSAPTLIAHGRNDRIVPFEEGRTLAGLIPAARLVPLESCNHILLPQEPAWTYFLAQVQAFLGEGQRSAVPQLPDDLSARELQVLELVTAWPSERADRSSALHQRADARASPLEHLPQVRSIREVGPRGRGCPLREHPRAGRPSQPARRVSTRSANTRAPPCDRARLAAGTDAPGLSSSLVWRLQMPQVDLPHAASAAIVRRSPVPMELCGPARRPALAFTLLGRFAVIRGNWHADDAAWERRVAQRVVRFLLLNRARAISEDEILEAFWPDRDAASGRRSLRVAVSRARSVLDTPSAASVIETAERTYRLTLHACDSVDADEFDTAARTALTEHGSARPGLLERAASLWGGDPLPEERYSDWALGWRERLTDLYVAVLAALCDSCLSEAM